MQKLDIRNEVDDADYIFNKEDIEVFNERREKRLKGESKIYSWQDAKPMIAIDHIKRKPI
jgi:hypothetical protein